MNRRVWIGLIVGLALVAGGAFAVHHYFAGDLGDTRETALELIPADTDSVVFADFTQLRGGAIFFCAERLGAATAASRCRVRKISA